MTEKLAGRIAQLMPGVKDELAQLVAIPSVADARQYPPENCHQAAGWVRDAFAPLGFDVKLEPTPDGSVAVIAHRAGPKGAPTVMLYCHYDVQPPLDDAAWRTEPFTLTEVGGRWYGRGTADCKGNIVAHLTALRALDDIPVGLVLVAEGSEEQGTGGLEAYAAAHPQELQADALLICDTGNAAVGRPTVTTSLRGLVNVTVTIATLRSPVHSGMFGGPAPDALAALIQVLSTLRDASGATTIDGLDCSGTWQGTGMDEQQFRSDAGVLAEVALLGHGAVADRLWARPAVTVLGIDCPPVVGSSASIPAQARARVSLRVPPGMSTDEAQAALIDHLRAHTPWGAHVTVEPESSGEPFRAETNGPAYRAMAGAMREAYGRDMEFLGQGGSIPLCNVLAGINPGAELLMIGVEEPACLIHAPNESVDPSEIEHMALVEARFLQLFATQQRAQAQGAT